MKSGWKLPASKKPMPRPLLRFRREVEFFAREERHRGVVECFEILDEVSLTLVERHWANFDNALVQDK